MATLYGYFLDVAHELAMPLAVVYAATVIARALRVRRVTTSSHAAPDARARVETALQLDRVRRAGECDEPIFDSHAERMLDGGDATFGRTDDGYDDPRGYA